MRQLVATKVSIRPIPILTIKSKDSITMEVMICTIPMPLFVLMAILSQLAHVACGIGDSNTVKNDCRAVALKLLQNLHDIIINSFTHGGPLKDFEIKDARYMTPVGADEMNSHDSVCLIIQLCPVVCSPCHFLSLHLYLRCLFG